MVQITARDKQALEFIGKWRFVTVGQLIKAGIFESSEKSVYKRLSVLRQNKYIKSNNILKNHIYYYLAEVGGAEIGLEASYWSKAYRDAGVNTVLQILTATDYALAVGIDFMTAQEIIKRLSEVKYDVLAACIKSKDRFFEKDTRLNTLIIDYELSLKSLTHKVKRYAKLPGDIKNNFQVIILTFSLGRQQQLKGVCRDAAVRTSIVRANWKY